VARAKKDLLNPFDELGGKEVEALKSTASSEKSITSNLNSGVTQIAEQKSEEKRSGVATLVKENKEGNTSQLDDIKKETKIPTNESDYENNVNEVSKPETFNKNENVSSGATQTTLQSQNSITQSFRNKMSKKGIDDTHIRKTFFINRQLFDIFDGLCKQEKKGYKTHVINEALRIALINELLENGESTESETMQLLFSLAPEE